MSHEPEEEAGTHINPHGPQWGSNQRRLDGEDGTHTTRVQGRLPGKAQLGRVEFEYVGTAWHNIVSVLREMVRGCPGIEWLLKSDVKRTACTCM